MVSSFAKKRRRLVVPCGNPFFLDRQRIYPFLHLLRLQFDRDHKAGPASRGLSWK